MWELPQNKGEGSGEITCGRRVNAAARLMEVHNAVAARFNSRRF